MQAIVFNVNPIGWVTCQWLKRFWPGCLTTKLNGISLEEISVPPLPGRDWVRLRTLLGGVCGSDLAILQQKQAPDSLLQAYTSQPMLLGHENVSIVDEVGPDVDPSWKGKRVLVEPTLGCVPRGMDPVCPRCEVGEYGACENFSGDFGGTAKLPPGVATGYNSATGGSWGEFFVAHESQLIDVPETVSDTRAILTDPLSCSLHGILRADLSEVRTVLVYGPGALGLGVIACLRALGYDGRIEVVGLDEPSRELTKQLGADEYLILPGEPADRFEKIAGRVGGNVQRARFGNYMISGGYDLVFDCVGSERSVQECMKFTRARGQMVMLGTLQGGKLDLTPLWFRELNIHGSYGRQLEHFEGGRRNSYEIILDWLADGTLQVDQLLTHTFRLSEYRRALEVAINKPQHHSIRVAFDFRESRL